MWPVSERTAWDLPTEVAGKQDHHTGLILGGVESEIILKVVQSCKGNSISVQVVENIHYPQGWHNEHVQSLDELDFLGIKLCMRTSVINHNMILFEKVLFVRGERLLCVLLKLEVVSPGPLGSKLVTHGVE